ncbi:hypothetical protein DW958_01775 [Ruminococcus sp. AM46-18]|nr:hypothetical protein DW958_01775 [Ruminococcus sp. AM46-18]
MRKKLLAGMLALALCSTNMPLQTIFAEEFTSGNPDVVSEEIPEIFTNEEQEAVGETDEELSAFGSEEIPEFNDAPDEAMAAAENARIKEIDLINSNEVINGVYTISSAGDYKFTCSNRQETANRIVVDGKNTSEQDNINIYLDNVNIKTSAGPALQIQRSVKTQVYIYLEGINKLNSEWNAALQKDNAAKLTIDNSPNTTGELIAISSYGAGIGGSYNSISSNITISGGSVTATSDSGAGIGGGQGNTGSKITISGGSVNAQIDCRPHKNLDSSGNYDQKSPNVYLCTIPNEGNDPITIDDTPWSPYSHIAVDPDEKKLYAWLTGETHTISVGNTTQTYYFDKTNQKFQPITNQDFTFTEPSNLTYNGKPKTASLQCNIQNMRNITWDYYKNDDNTPQTNGAVDAGTYTVKANIEENAYYSSISNLTDSSWTFTINPAPKAPGYTSETTKYVSWSYKKISDIPNLLPTDAWKWDTNVNPDQELPVGTPITATAIYNGSDKGNYQKEEINYTITREECTHEHTAGRYYSSPSCTSSGYSGDTYCKDCNKTLSYGYTISAYGHDYDNGVITTEPTAETDGIITYTCKRCKHQDTKNLGKLGDGEPYIEGSFQKKGWDAVNNLIKASKEKDTISIIMNGARTLPASVLSEIKGKDISLNLDMENGFIWKINGTSITTEIPADTDLSVTNTAEYIPAALYSLISANQNDFGFHLGRSGAFDFPAVFSVKADASCAGIMANLFWYDVENGVLQCIQTVTVGGAFERSIPYADFTLSKGQDYFIAFGTESLNGRVIHTDGSITDENGAYLRPANTKISSYSIDRNKLTVKLSKGCAGAQGYDFVISKKSDMLKTGKFSKTVSSTGKPQASFRYLAKGTWYVAARSWVLDAQGNKVYGSWTKVKKIKITVVTPQQPKIRNITVKGNTVTVTYTKCKNATGYEILLGNKYKTSAGEKYPVKKHLKRTEGKNTVTVTFTNVKKGTWYVTVRSWNKTSKDKSRVYSPYSTMQKFKTKK